MSGLFRGPNSSAVADALNVDGDKGDLTISNSGLEWRLNDKVVTYTKIQDVSANTLLGKDSTSGTVQEITCTQAGRNLLDDADTTTQRTTLGLGNVDNTSDANKPVSTATQNALNLKADIDGSNATGTWDIDVEFQQSGTGAVATTVDLKLKETVSVKDFGAVGDGIADDTASVMAAHVYANSVKAPVSYLGCSKVALQANAQIPVNTSIDFNNCELVILGGVNSPPTFSTFNTLYYVTDPDCPLVTVTGAVTASNLNSGSLFPTLGLFNGHGYAFLECGLQIPNRLETGTVNYQQAFKINRNGRASLPLSTDLSAFASAITVSYRNTSKNRLVIKNIELNEGVWNNQCVFRIERCNVEVDNFTMMFTGGTFNNIQNIIKIEHSSDITIRNFISTGRPVTTTAGSYNLDINGGADIIIDNMNALTGWGATGTNHVNGMKYVNCTLNRVDTHAGGHNIFVENCDLHETGVVYGWGGGVISVKNSRMNRCDTISTRGDYGGQFFGDLLVADCEVTNNFTGTLSIVNLESNALGASTPVHAPRTISVTNATRCNSASTTGVTEIIPVRIRIKNDTSVVYSPNLIKVDNINYFRNWRFGLRLDILNMEASPIFGGLLQVVCTNTYPTNASTSTTGILDYVSIRTPVAKVQPFFFVSNCEHVHISCQSDNNARITLNNCGVNAIAVNPLAAVQPLVALNFCRLISPATGYSPTPVGGSRSGNNNFTSLFSCDISSTTWDLSLVSAAQGNLMRNGSLTPTLPAGATPTDFFTGFRASGAFKT